MIAVTIMATAAAMIGIPRAVYGIAGIPASEAIAWSVGPTPSYVSRPREATGTGTKRRQTKRLSAGKDRAPAGRETVVTGETTHPRKSAAARGTAVAAGKAAVAGRDSTMAGEAAVSSATLGAGW